MKLSNLFRKEISRLDVVDAIWDDVLEMKDGKNVPIHEDITWEEYALLCCEANSLSLSDDEKRWHLEDGAKMWLWEKEFLYQKPARTMEYFYGEHVMLYYVLGCKKHRVLVTAYDDDRIVWNSTIICPECNKDSFRVLEPKEYPLEVKYVETDEEWAMHLNWSKNHKRDVAWSNFKYRLKNPRFTIWKLKRKLEIGVKNG